MKSGCVGKKDREQSLEDKRKSYAEISLFIQLKLTLFYALGGKEWNSRYI